MDTLKDFNAETVRKNARAVARGEKCTLASDCGGAARL